MTARIVLIAAIALGLTLVGFSAGRSQDYAAWEYRAVVGHPQLDMDRLNALGYEGWELVATSSTSADKQGNVIAYLKRPAY